MLKKSAVASPEVCMEAPVTAAGSGVAAAPPLQRRGKSSSRKESVASAQAASAKPVEESVKNSISITPPTKNLDTVVQITDVKNVSPGDVASLVTPPRTQPPAKRQRTVAKDRQVSSCSVDIDEEVLSRAEALGLTVQLKNLAARDAIVKSGLKASKLLAALQENGGLVNKAKDTLLGI